MIVEKKKKKDDFFMLKALKLAQKAYDVGEVPVGAVIVSPQGALIGRGYNKSFLKKAQSKHAEMIAIEKACQKIDDWRLEGCTLYVTLEPCLMCLGAALLSRVERIVYGASSPLFGATTLLSSCPALYNKHLKELSSGLCAEQAVALLSAFFKNRRNQE